MAVFKRVKLFTNVSEFDDSNIVYDEVWGYKISPEEDEEGNARGVRVGRYRIRYQRTDSVSMLAEAGASEAEMRAMEQAMAELGPAISCVVESWTDSGWVRCLDWLGDPSTLPEKACLQINDQYRAFLTGKPIEETYYSSPSRPPVGPEKKTKKPPKPKKPEEPDDAFDWV